MSSEPMEGRLYALMATAADTQAASEAALAALGQQIEAQRDLTARLGEALQRIDGAGAQLDEVGRTVGPALVGTVREAVTSSVHATAAEHGEMTRAATHEAIAETVGEQATTLQATAARTEAAATAVEARLRSAASGLGWRWAAMAAAAMVAGIVATVGVGHAVGWWLGGQIEQQRATIERLAPEVARLEALEARAEELAPAARFLRGLPAESFGTCGEGQCVMVDERRRASRREEDPEHSAVYQVWGTGGDSDW